MKNKFLLSIKEAGTVLGISRSSVYKLLEYDYLKSLRVLGRRMITVKSVVEFINSNIDEQI